MGRTAWARRVRILIWQNSKSILALSGLRYGVSERRVRQMLIRGGGMCGGWYLMFQQMAHIHGVFVHRRCFLVHWRTLPNGEESWCALSFAPEA